MALGVKPTAAPAKPQESAAKSVNQQLNVLLPPGQIEQLRMRRVIEGRPVNEIVSQAVKEYMERNK